MEQRTFTLAPLRWQPWLSPLLLDEADEQQLKALTAAGAITRDSPYFRTLAHAPEMLSARMALYNDIVYGREGLSRAEREFAMFAVSRTNGCVYCASVHGRRFVELFRQEGLLEPILHSVDISALSPRLQTIFQFAAKITDRPHDLGANDRKQLQSAGLTDVEILDLVHATAMFAWANTLMLALGQPEPA